MYKLPFSGCIYDIKPLVSKTNQTIKGYVLYIRGLVDGECQEFSVRLGKTSFEKHEFVIGDGVSGDCLPLPDEDTALMQYYKVSCLKKSWIY